MLRLFYVCLVAAVLTLTAAGEEAIKRYEAAIKVETDGDIVVKETISLTSEGREIRRGIFRDLPRFFESEGDKLRYDYDVISVWRNGTREPYETMSEGNAFRIRIGDAERLLPRGEHTYEIRYRVSNQVRYFEGYDELYWNVTGSYWSFPIRKAVALVQLPKGAGLVEQNAYTGRQGRSENAYSFSRDGNLYTFETTQRLGPQEGLTISLAFEKGAVDPPSLSDRSSLWWQRRGALVILGVSLLGVFVFLYRSWRLVGVDPPKGPVFARYEPPKGYSPAAVHHIYHRGFNKHDALIATLVNLGIKDVIEIDAREKKKTVLTPKQSGHEKLSGEEGVLVSKLLSGAPVTLGGEENEGFTSAYTKFRKRVSRRFGEPYFKWNLGYTLFAVGLSIVAVIWAVAHATSWSWWLMGLIGAIVLMNGIFMYLMPSPTPKGQKVRTAIEGFRLYMDKAEKLQLNAAEPGSGEPPPMTKERYERFLPYAIALGVEKPWTKYFEKTLPREAADYDPAWSHMGYGHASLASLNDSLVSNISSGVTSSMPQSSGSSGIGGGGFSGGGGGGGGGGGW
ncbi:DUF2207 domain-containing protein [Henriciella sp.]|uniref:DUF2207 domain-containing protein n=1 Tax=Henriciella sp. TaxID=1968823 RepID=UPI002631891E|nr:DUF2207 domain-containing protein [Henriciella sp.]